MSELTALHRALLDLGLEDWIPLPEAVATREVLEAVGTGDVVERVSHALVDLLRLDRVEIWSGHWDAPEPSPVPTAAAEDLLLDTRRYSFDVEKAEGLDRVYYVNVDNFRSGT